MMTYRLALKFAMYQTVVVKLGEELSVYQFFLHQPTPLVMWCG